MASLSKIEKRLEKIEKVMLRNTLSLEMHMKRTELLETQVKSLAEKDQTRKGVSAFIDNGFKVVMALIAAAVGLKNLNIFKF